MPSRHDRFLALLVLAALALGTLGPAGVGAQSASPDTLALDVTDATFAPHETLTVNLTLTNNGNAPHRYRVVEASEPDGDAPSWRVTVPEGAFTLDTGASRTFVVRVEAPDVQPGGHEVALRFVARSEEDGAVRADAELLARVVRVRAVSQPGGFSMVAGDVATVPVTFTNPTPFPLEAELLSGYTMSGSRIPDSAFSQEPAFENSVPVTLPAGGSRSFDVTYRLSEWNERLQNRSVWFALAPAGAEAPPADPLHEGSFPPIAFGVAYTNITIVRPTTDDGDAERDASEPPAREPVGDPWPERPDYPVEDTWPVEIGTSASALLVAPGSETEITLTLRNTRPVPERVRVAPAGAAEEGWVVSPPGHSVHLEPGGQETVTFTVGAPDAIGSGAVLRFEAERESEPGSGIGQIAIPGWTTRATEDIRVGVAQERPLTEEPFGSFAVQFSVSNAGSTPRTLMLLAFAIYEPDLDVTWSRDTVTLAPGETAYVEGRVIAPLDPFLVEGNKLVLFAARDADTGEEATWSRFFSWETFVPYDERRASDENAAAPTPLRDAAALASAHPTAAAAAGTVTVASVGAGVLAVRRRESFRYLVLAPLVGLFTRIAKPRALDHAARARLHALVQERPGATLAELTRATGLASGTVAHHLRTLERHGLVTSRRDGPFRRFHSVGAPQPPVVVASPAEARVLDQLAGEPLSLTELAARLGVTKQGAHYHVKALERRGLVTRVRDGATWRYVAAENAALRP